MIPVVARTASPLRTGWREALPAQRAAAGVGLALVAVGLLQGLLWLLLGGSAEGPLSWRKPVTFGISFGITTLTLAWVSSHLALPRRWVTASLVVVAAANTCEVTWVTLQHARGVPSHFNQETSLDGALFIANGVAIAATVAVIAVYTVCSFVRPSAPPALALGLRVGLLLLLVSMATGVWMILREMAFGLPPTQVAPGGSVKALHAVGMHGLQVVAVLAWVLSSVAVPEASRVRLVATAAAGYVLLTGSVAVLTLSGASPLGGGAGGWTVRLLAVALVAGPWSVAAVAAGAALRDGRHRDG